MWSTQAVVWQDEDILADVEAKKKYKETVPKENYYMAYSARGKDSVLIFFLFWSSDLGTSEAPV